MTPCAESKAHELRNMEHNTEWHNRTFKKPWNLLATWWQIGYGKWRQQQCHRWSWRFEPRNIECLPFPLRIHLRILTLDYEVLWYLNPDSHSSFIYQCYPPNAIHALVSPFPEYTRTISQLRARKCYLWHKCHLSHLFPYYLVKSHVAKPSVYMLFPLGNFPNFYPRLQ